MRILAIGAHPDDIEFGCAGTLARCIRRGDAVVMAVACVGDSASPDLSREELAKVRSVELKNSAKTLGAELIEMGLPDYGVWPSREAVMLFTDVVRRAKPDVVITHGNTDYGGDHNNTHALVLDATVAATVRNVKTEHPPIPKPPYIFMMEPLGGYGFNPHVYVDITETFDVKIRMLQCHVSQMQWMSRYGGFDSCKYVDVAARFRGYQAGVTMAEGFVPHPSFGRVPCGSVLP
jgi:LmbE family N-acetylglucosaminyl deacetylase